MGKTKQTIPRTEVFEWYKMKVQGYAIHEIAKYWHRDHKTVQQLLADFGGPHRDVLPGEGNPKLNLADDKTPMIRCKDCGGKTTRVCKKAPTTCVACHMKQSSQVLTKTGLGRF
jgi:hypothetical protein